jgi:O-antigen/teichoic acid export membrane protein
MPRFLNDSPRASPQRTPLSAAGAVLQSIGAKLLVVGINVVTGIITARKLQPAGRGELAAMILWPVFLSSILTLGVPSALTFQLKSNPRRSSQLTGTALLLAILTSGIALVVGFLFMQSWIAQYPPRVVLFARIFLLSAPLTSLLLVGRAALESRNDFGASNMLLVCTPSLTLLCLLALLAAHALTPYSAGMAYVPAGLVPTAWMMRRLWRVFQPSLRSFQDSAKLLFSYGIRSYGIDLCGTMALYVDQALVVRILAPKMMGIYVVALSLSRMLNAFHTSVIMVLFPKAVSQSPDTVREMTSRAMRMSTVLTAIVGTIIAILGPQALSLLYGAEYRTASTVLRILVLEVILSGATLVLSQAFMALGRPGVVTALQVTGLVLTIPLMILLVPRYGIVGAGIALLVSTTSRFILVLLSFPLFLKMQVPAFLPKWQDVNYMTSTVFKYFHLFPNKNLQPAQELDS